MQGTSTRRSTHGIVAFLVRTRRQHHGYTTEGCTAGCTLIDGLRGEDHGKVAGIHGAGIQTGIQRNRVTKSVVSKEVSNETGGTWDECV